ncbi:MAG: hypothetical protein JWS12_91 [Candidatus Saccharibacteria bacterium]|nr:hypothetical protein [Candidatus Saccharibacteria bacterium]
MEPTQKLFIIHGWTYNLEKWTVITDLLTKEGFRPVQLKVPGLASRSKKVWDIDSYMAWLDQQLEGEEHPIVIGHSNGGRIALAYAQKYPERLAQLILIDSAGIPNDHYLTAKLKLKTLRGVSKLGQPVKRVPGVRRVFYKIIGARDYEQAPPNMKKTMANMLAADKTIHLRSIKTPVTLVWGRNDSTTPLRDGRLMRRKIRGAKLFVVEGARHAPMATHPQKVAQIIAKVVQP